MAGYSRTDTTNNIADGNIINASDFDGEFDAIATAFGTSGHTHDGTSENGGAITKIGPAQDLVVSASLVTPNFSPISLSVSPALLSSLISLLRASRYSLRFVIFFILPDFIISALRTLLLKLIHYSPTYWAVFPVHH